MAQGVGHLRKPSHNVVLVCCLRAFPVRDAQHPAGVGIGQGHAAFILPGDAGETVIGIIGIAPEVPVGIGVGNPVARCIIGVSTGVPQLIRHTGQAV